MDPVIFVLSHSCLVFEGLDWLVFEGLGWKRTSGEAKPLTGGTKQHNSKEFQLDVGLVINSVPSDTVKCCPSPRVVESRTVASQ